MIRKYLLAGIFSASPVGMRETPGASWPVCRREVAR